MIETSELCKRFGKHKALNGVSIAVPTGSVYGLIGKNGAGKSTLLRCLAGVYQIDGGSILMDGTCPYDNASVKAGIAFVPDVLHLPWGATRESLARLMQSLYATWDGAFYQELCGRFPLDNCKGLRELSKGMQRQVMLTCALATKPKYLLLDEVFDGLDPTVRKELRQILMAEVAERGMTILLSTHNLRELEDLCDRLALLQNGKIRLEKELDTIQAELHRLRLVFPQTPPLAAIAEQLVLLSSKAEGTLLTITARGNLEEIEGFLQGFAPTLLERIPLSLEEIFISEMEAVGYEGT